MEREIVVRGEGEVRALPDRASVRLVVDGDGSSREEAYGVAASLTSDVDAVLAAETEALGRVTTTALLVQPQTKWRKGETVRTGWRASRTSVIEIIQLQRLGEILARLSSMGAAIAGPWWELDPSHEAYSRARREAAADARRRGQEYAEALGIEVSHVAWVAEPGLRLSGPQGGVRMQAASALAGMAEETIEVAPEELTVRASIDVGFAIADR